MWEKSRENSERIFALVLSLILLLFIVYLVLNILWNGFLWQEIPVISELADVVQHVDCKEFVIT